MRDVAPPAGQRAAAEYVRQLLLKPGRYRQAWEQQVARLRDGVINQMAVAEVIATRLRSAPGRVGDAQIMPYQLRDIVADVLSGRHVSRDSLQMFIDGFAFTNDETARLWRLWNGATTIRVLAGTKAVPARAEHGVSQALGPRRHQTVSLHDHVWIGADGRIERTHVMQVVEATAEEVDRIPFLADTNVLTVEVGLGCRGLAADVRQIADDVFMTEIILAKTLQLGETAALGYWVTFRYPGDMTCAAEREFRRAVMGQITSYDIRVEFHSDRLPSKLWWASWEGVDGAVIDEQEVSLDSQHSAHRYLRSVERTVAGFHWIWS